MVIACEEEGGGEDGETAGMGDDCIDEPIRGRLGRARR